MDASEIDIDANALAQISEAFASIEENAGPATEAISSLWEVLNPFNEYSPDGVAGLYENVLVPLAAWSGINFADSLNIVLGALVSISDWMAENQGLIQNIAFLVQAFMAAWEVVELLSFVEQAGGVGAVLGLVAQMINENIIAKIADRAETLALTAMYAKDFVMSLVQTTAELAKNAAQWVITTGLKVADTVQQWAMIAATTAWNAVCSAASAVTTAFGAAVAFLTSPIALVILAIAGLVAIIVLLVKNWDTVKATAESVLTGIQVAWATIAAWFNTTVWTPLLTAVSTCWSSITSTILSVWTGIQNIWGKVASWFDTNVWGPFKQGLSNLGDFFVSIWNGIISALETAINWILSGVNSAISFINNLLSSASSLLKKVGINISISVPKIPKVSLGRLSTFAEGGIPEYGSLFIAREAGAELVGGFGNQTGVMNNDQIVESVSQGVYEAVLAALGRGSSVIENKIYLDGKQLTAAVEKNQRERGATLLPGGLAYGY